MAISTARRLTNYGAIVRDSTALAIRDSIVPTFTVAQSTVQHLVDPKTNEEFCLIGTTNMSTRLAVRTKKLIENYKPDAVFVQASEVFYHASRAPANCHDSLEKNLALCSYHYVLDNKSRLDFNIKNVLFYYRKALMSLFVHHVLRTPWDWKSIFTPGLEIKYALDYVEENKVPVFYAGEEFDLETNSRMQMQKDFDVIWPLLNYYFVLNTHWKFECKDMGRLFQFHNLKDLCENHFDKDKMAWWVGFFGTMFPGQKRSLIDQREEEMFHFLETRLTGSKKKLAVVNQWHMDGLERLWRRQHGLEIKRPATTGAEDFPLAEQQAYMEGIDSDRERLEKITGAPMASSHRTLVAYNDESRSHFA